MERRQPLSGLLRLCGCRFLASSLRLTRWACDRARGVGRWPAPARSKTRLARPGESYSDAIIRVARRRARRS
jgi:hypothetical protein